MIATAATSFSQFRLEQCVPASGSASYQAFLAQQVLRRVFITRQSHVDAGAYWAVKIAGEDQPIFVHSNQLDAIDAARALLNAVPGGGSMMIQRVDGSFREERTINHPDPFPPYG